MRDAETKLYIGGSRATRRDDKIFSRSLAEGKERKGKSLKEAFVKSLIESDGNAGENVTESQEGSPALLGIRKEMPSTLAHIGRIQQSC